MQCLYNIYPNSITPGLFIAKMSKTHKVIIDYNFNVIARVYNEHYNKNTFYACYFKTKEDDNLDYKYTLNIVTFKHHEIKYLKSSKYIQNVVRSLPYIIDDFTFTYINNIFFKIPNDNNVMYKQTKLIVGILDIFYKFNIIKDVRNYIFGYYLDLIRNDYKNYPLIG